MPAPTINHLDGDLTYRSPGDTYRIDQNGDAIVNDSDNDLTRLEVLLDLTDGAIGIDTEGKVSLNNGVISVEGVEIGAIEGDFDPLHLVIAFNHEATSTRVQELIRALTYTAPQSAGGFSRTGAIYIDLQDGSGSWGGARVDTADRLVGTEESDTFSATSHLIWDGDQLDGGAGDDIFQLINGGTFDLYRMANISGIETIQGSLANDIIIIKGAQLSDVRSIDSGGGTEDKLTITGTVIDLSSTVISGFRSIVLADHAAQITVGNAETAKIVTGYTTANDRLILTNGTLTVAERLLLHRRGVDTIIAKDASGREVSTTHRPPQIAAFDGAMINAPIGTKAFLDRGQDAALTVDSGILESLLVQISGAADPTELLGVQEGNGVRLLGRAVYVDDIMIGSLFDEPDSLSFSFDQDATDARVQKLIRALTYTKTDGSADKLRKVTFLLKDIGGRETKAEVSLDLSSNTPPSDIGLTGKNVREVSPDNAWIGDLSATDAVGSTFTFTLVDDAGGRFKIDGSQLRVNTGTLLDHEQAKSHSVRVKVTDQGGLSYEKSFVIDVDDVAQETVTGTAANEVFIGGSGRDKLDGGYGNDRLTGGKGRDTFVFKDNLSKTGNVDTITDFKPKDDAIQLENRIFKKLSKTGVLKKDFFTAGSKAKDKNDYIVYDKTNGHLFYDADGSGKGKAVLFAKLKAALDHKDFFVI
ncbi:hypothetical protein [Microvirga soli]|uniref:hypothetical protein n=1 Tax=Microvirga soli TaxID=1854496 RepID=UPI00191EB57E|nr:hypothetical protein [Microvirga soli]